VSRFFPVHIRVQWADTDAAGIVWFGNFFRFFEQAEDELFRALGRPRLDVIRDCSIFLPRVEASCRYRSPAKFGELLEVGVGIDELAARRISFRFEVREHESRRLVAEGSSRVACVNSQTFTPQDFPGAVHSLLGRFDQVVPVLRSNDGADVND
jgi:acyl-CoA thioester hydrolase